MMATLGLYFPLSNDAANALRARINALAQSMGYNTVATLLQAVDAGEVALVLLADEETMRAIPALEKLFAADEFHNSWAGSLAHSLRAAIERMHAADAAEIAEYCDENLPLWALKHPAVMALCERDPKFRDAVMGAKNYPYRQALIDQATGRLG